MASSYTLKSDSYDGRYMQLTCTQEKNIASNKSKIAWTLSSVGGNSNYYSTGPTSVTINGSQVYYLARKNWDAKTFPAAKGSVSGTIEVDHDTYGNKSITVSFTTAIYSGTTKTYSSTWTLDNIPRAATVTNVPSSFTSDGALPTIKFSNPAGDNASLHICIADKTAYIGYTPYRKISDKDKKALSYTFSAEDIETLKTKAGNTLDVTFVLQTTISGSNFWHNKPSAFKMVEDGTTKPTLTMNVSVDNSSLPSQFDGLYVQGKSKCKVTMSAVGKYGAKINSYSAILDEKTYNSNDFTSEAVKSADNVLIKGSAKDSRGFTGIQEKTINVIRYSKPLVIPIGSENAILCYRSDANGKRVGKSTSVRIKAKRFYEPVFSNGVQKNFCALQWRKKLTKNPWDDNNPEHEWKDLIPKTNTTDDAEYNALLTGDYAVFDETKSYTVQIRAIDDFGEYDLKTFEIPTEDVALHLGKGGKNVSIGTYCDYAEERTFYSDWDAYFDKDVYVGGNKIVDFPIEVDTSGIWTYKKWNSGDVELWGKANLDVFGDTRHIYKNEPLPFSFAVQPIVNMTIDTAEGYTYLQGAIVLSSSYTSGATVIRLSMIRDGGGLASGNKAQVNVHIKGRWK